MSLTLVSVPIGNFADITLRAIESLKAADAIICEEIRPAQTLLKRLGLLDLDRPMHQLNEHTKDNELPKLLEVCVEKNAALITDCGTPGFCDPGARLVDLCLKRGVPVDTNPGASSLMALLSLCGYRMDEFHFAGFLPAETQSRQLKIQSLQKLNSAIVLMDTPYRLDKLLQELCPLFSSRQAVLGIDLTGENHRLVRGAISEIAKTRHGKHPFVLLILKG